MSLLPHGGRCTVRQDDDTSGRLAAAQGRCRGAWGVRKRVDSMRPPEYRTDLKCQRLLTASPPKGRSADAAAISTRPSRVSSNAWMKMRHGAAHAPMTDTRIVESLSCSELERSESSTTPSALPSRLSGLPQGSNEPQGRARSVRPPRRVKAAAVRDRWWKHSRSSATTTDMAMVAGPRPSLPYCPGAPGHHAVRAPPIKAAKACSPWKFFHHGGPNPSIAEEPLATLGPRKLASSAFGVPRTSARTRLEIVDLRQC
jgi:hypothetical protein